MSDHRIKLVFCSDGDSVYVWANDWSMRREVGGITPNGNETGHFWVLRNPRGEFVDYDQYRFDIAPRWNLEI